MELIELGFASVETKGVVPLTCFDDSNPNKKQFGGSRMNSTTPETDMT